MILLTIFYQNHRWWYPLLASKFQILSMITTHLLISWLPSYPFTKYYRILLFLLYRLEQVWDLCHWKFLVTKRSASFFKKHYFELFFILSSILVPHHVCFLTRTSLFPPQEYPTAACFFVVHIWSWQYFVYGGSSIRIWGFGWNINQILGVCHNLEYWTGVQIFSLLFSVT